MARVRLLVLGLAVLGALDGPAALAQRRAKIWDVAVGTDVASLPKEFVIQACGTNGGPPSRSLDGFGEYAKCPAERTTGLHEVWFSYDDELEYVYRAHRAPEDILGQFLANQEFLHPVVFSLLIDDAGKVQGYRLVSDSREAAQTRVEADVVATPLRLVVYGPQGWTCTDLPRREGEEPLGAQFVKESCVKLDDGRHITLERHIYQKAGQANIPGRTAGVNEFEVRVRLEVISAARVR